MLVTVWTSDGAKHVTLPQHATIEDLKEVLVEHLNYDPRQLEISHGGRFVRDEVSVARFPPNTLVAEGPRFVDDRNRYYQQHQQPQYEQQPRHNDPQALFNEVFGRPGPRAQQDSDDDNGLNSTQGSFLGAPRPQGHHPHRQRQHQQRQLQQTELEEQQRYQQYLRQQQLEQQQQRQLQEEQHQRQAQKQREDRQRALRDREEALRALEAKRAAIRRQEEEIRRQREEIAQREMEIQRQLEEEARLLEQTETEEEEEDEMTRENTLVLHPHLQRVGLDETIHQPRSRQPSPATSGTTTPVKRPRSGEDAQSTPSTPPPQVPQSISVNVIIPELDDKTITVSIGYDAPVADVIAAIKQLEPEATKSGIRLMFCDKYVRSEKESIRSVPLMDGSTVVACTGKYLSENEMTLYLASSKLKEVRKAVEEHPERPIDRNLKLHWNELLMKALMQLDSLQEVPDDIRLRRKASVKEVMAEQDVLAELK